MTESYDGAYAEEPHYFGKQASPLLSAYAQLVPTRARVLDIVIGQGRNALALAARGCHVTGIDTSDVALEQVGERARAEGALIQGPVDHGPPVGYWAFLRDPDGHTLEISHGQEVALAVAHPDGGA